MSDYTPVYVKGEIITLTASGAVSGGDVLEVSGVSTVQRCATLASLKVVGVAAEDTLTAGRVSFWARGPVHESIADGIITAGDVLTSTNTAARSVKTLALAPTGVALGGVYVDPGTSNAINAVGAADNATRAMLGVAITSAADGGKVRWMLF
jgi:hypothetical protein